MLIYIVNIEYIIPYTYFYMTKISLLTQVLPVAAQRSDGYKKALLVSKAFLGGLNDRVYSDYFSVWGDTLKVFTLSNGLLVLSSKRASTV